MNRRKLVPLLVVIILVALFVGSCDVFPTKSARPNLPPHTKLANIPRDNDTIFPLAAFHWTGGDEDGFVTHFQWRYVTHHLLPGSQNTWVLFDSTEWKDTTSSSATIPFNSSDVINRQRFMVRAIDNDGAADPNPATRVFYTTRASPPKTTLLYPKRNDTVLAVNKTTDWWSGVRITFSAFDRTVGGKIDKYGWSVDGGPWQWTEDTMVYVKPQDFKPPLLGTHLIKVTSVNNTNLIDPIGDSAFVTILVPTFSKKVLIIDETDEFNSPFITQGIVDAQTDAFYAEVFPGSDSWDYKSRGMPPRHVMASYKLVVWHADDIPVVRPHKISDPLNIEVFTDYLNVGGKFLMSGWRILKSFAYLDNFPFTFPAGTFVNDYLHIQTVDETTILGDCIGGRGKAGYFSSFAVDSAKLAFFPYFGKLAQVNLITKPAGFTDILYSYVNRDDSPYVTYRGRAIGLRYYGTVYDAVVLGFPLYFVKKEDAIKIADEILRSLHVN